MPRSHLSSQLPSAMFNQFPRANPRANRRPSSAPHIMGTPSSANRAVDAGPTVASEIPDNPAAPVVTIGYDQVDYHIEETGVRSRSTVANKSCITPPSVYPPTLITYPSNLPIERGLAADNDSHMPKHRSANIGTATTNISTTFYSIQRCL